nr:MAG TPA: hypothetical protein [Bacteriophage sp.]DAZ51541.1 MAG TPA: hypothetical protein [Caudoviricetes sp.]
MWHLLRRTHQSNARHYTIFYFIVHLVRATACGNK